MRPTWTRRSALAVFFILAGCELEPNPSPSGEPSIDGPGDGLDGMSDGFPSVDGTDAGGRDDSTDGVAADGHDAMDAIDGDTDGTDATDGMDGTDGIDGTDGTTSPDGTDAVDSATDATDTTDGADATDGTDGTDGTDAAETPGCDLVCPLGCTMPVVGSPAADGSDGSDSADVTDGTDATDPVPPPDVPASLTAAVALTGWSLAPGGACPEEGSLRAALEAKGSLASIQAAITAMDLAVAWASAPDGSSGYVWPIHGLDCADPTAGCTTTALRPELASPACAPGASVVAAGACVSSPCDPTLVAPLRLPWRRPEGGATLDFDAATVTRSGGELHVCGEVRMNEWLSAFGAACKGSAERVATCQPALLALVSASYLCPLVDGDHVCIVSLTATETPLAQIVWPAVTP